MFEKLAEAARRRRDAANRKQAVAESSLLFTKRSFIVGAIAAVLGAVGIVIPLVVTKTSEPRIASPDDAIVDMDDISADSPTWIVPATVGDLGEPPSYTPDSPDSGEYHCDDWHEWLDRKGAAPALGISYIFVAAPAGAEVNITDARVRVIRKFATPTTLVQCLYGAGGHSADPASLDLDSPSPEIAIESASGPVVVRAGRGQYRTSPGSSNIVAISPKGTVGYMYEYEITLTYTVNAETLTETSRPFRFHMREPAVAQPTAYDYDPNAKSWFETPALAY